MFLVRALQWVPERELLSVIETALRTPSLVLPSVLLLGQLGASAAAG